jgi:regulatory protein
LIITKILKSKKHRDRYSIQIDGGPGFDVSADVLQKFSLHVDQKIDDQIVERIATTEAHHRAQAIAFNYLSYRPRSFKEVVDHLVRKGYTRELGQKVARTLQGMKYIDDTEFARTFVRDRLKRRPSGSSLLRHALFSKGISPVIVEKVLKEYVFDDEQLEAAQRLAERRLGTGSLTKMDKLKRKKRVFDYLLRRGFSTEITTKAVRSLFSSS